ncbi:alpha/beta hydrolase [uncultured Nevskia sp.]|uniref:alpha/beta fold hydrolase n=1 Tax=uncultured Nevskia sp. TaxID=228950 RepID=UPI0025F8880A|nr:alpha/beta hydrolase [uncultured Nevskia sp.]
MTGSFKTIDANGVSFACIEKGKGPLLLCLHGFPDHAPTFRSIMPALANAGYRVVAPYMKGYWPTVAPAGSPYQAAALGLDVAALIEALSPDEPACVFGHDWGAIAAYAAALAAPQRIRRLVVSSVPYGPQFLSALVTRPDQIRRSFYIWFFQLPMAEAAMAANDFAFIRTLWRDWSPGWQLPEADWQALRETFARPGVIEAALAYYRHMFNPALQHSELAELQHKIFIAPIDVPTLVLHGEGDGCIAVDLLDGMETAFPRGLEKHIVLDAGHFPHAEKPAEVAAAICRFLAR